MALMADYPAGIAALQENELALLYTNEPQLRALRNVSTGLLVLLDAVRDLEARMQRLETQRR